MKTTTGFFKSRYAFTLVELLVVVAIIGVLVGLTVPAIQAVRESARKTQCANNLKQIGLAIGSHQSHLGHFPTVLTGPGQPDGRGGCGAGYFSWLARILPYLEQKALYESINFRVNMADQCDTQSAMRVTISAEHPNAVAAATSVAVFICPSDSPRDSDVMGTARPAPSSYMGNLGWPAYSTGIEGQERQPGRHNGLFGAWNPAMPAPWHLQQVKPRDVTDGLSSTVAVVERLIVRAEAPGGILADDPRVRWYCGGSSTRKATLQQYQRACTVAPNPDGTVSIFQGRAWISGWPLAANAYTHVMTPNTRSCFLHGGEYDGNLMVGPSSRHPGGVHLLMADGRVTFVTDEVDTIVWWAAGSRDGEESFVPSL